MNTQKGKYRHLLLYGGSVVVAVICLFPIFFALFASFKPNREMYLYPPSILPKTWTLEAYLSILSQKKILVLFFQCLGDFNVYYTCLCYSGGISRIWLFEIPTPR